MQNQLNSRVGEFIQSHCNYDSTVYKESKEVVDKHVDLEVQTATRRDLRIMAISMWNIRDRVRRQVSKE